MYSFRSRCGALVLASACIVVLGCGGAEAPAAENEGTNVAATTRSKTRIDACALLTQEEAEQVLGESVAPPANQVVSQGGANRAAISQCRYQGTSRDKTLTVFIRRSPRADHQPDSVRDTLAQTGVAPQDVSGVGERALWAAEQLHVFAKDNLYLIVTVNGLADPTAQQQAVSVARRVLERA